jgi:predicted component of type VI protein secretion system
MQPERSAPTEPQPQKPAVEHVSEAHRLLQNLRGRLDEHPELEQAIEELEMALSVLAVKTGGML